MKDGDDMKRVEYIDVLYSTEDSVLKIDENLQENPQRISNVLKQNTRIYYQTA